MRDVIKCIEQIGEQHVPRSVQDLRKLNSKAAFHAAKELSEIDSSCGSELPQSIGSLQQTSSLIERCKRLAAVCDEAKESPKGLGWESPAWQECKIFSHLCASSSLLVLLIVEFYASRCLCSAISSITTFCCRYAAYFMLLGPADEDSSGAGPDIMAGKAVVQVDLALMSGCPYNLAEPLLAHAVKHLGPVDRHAAGTMNRHEQFTATSRDCELYSSPKASTGV